MVSPLPKQHDPRLVRGQVRHARLSPFTHAFSYRAFYVQMPIRSLARQAPACAGNRIWGINQGRLLRIDDRDHGDGRPLLEWAESILRQANVTDADGEIWLQTFPKMLGYVFKPVSFWFCENQAGQIRAVIAEVNNTFGDRHVYVLTPPPAAQGILNGAALETTKAFYVSPFFEVRGRYLFRFFKSDLGGHDVARIEYSDQEGALLITSMSGQSEPLTRTSACLAWLRYPMFSIGVIARIHWQALRLWIKGAKLAPRPKAVQ